MVTRERPTSAFDLVAPVATSADAESLDVLFRRFAPYVAKIGYRLLGRQEEVDDLVQDVFLDAHRGLRRLREAEAVKGWLATVAVRKAKRRLRARKLRALLRLDDAPDYVQIADDGASPEDRALLAGIYRVLDGLSVDERLAWTLRYVEGEKLERVAELCHCSLATAKRRIKSAHAAIREEVGHG